MIDEPILRLHYRGALDWTAALQFFRRRGVEGVERVDAGTYWRTVRLAGAIGVLSVSCDANALTVCVSGADLPLPQVQDRVRLMFDLDADLPAINAHLGRDPLMAPLVSQRPAMRVAGGWDPFEIAVRTIVGQQVSVARARQLNGVLVARCGATLPRRRGDASERLCRLFPTPGEVLGADLSSLGMPGARVASLKTLAAAAIEREDLFERGATLDATIARLRQLRGIGEWTAHYIAMRAFREPDAFPASDIGLLRAAADASGRRPAPAALLGRAEAWRPWRAYAAHHLWASDSNARDGVSSEGTDGTLES